MTTLLVFYQDGPQLIKIGETLTEKELDPEEALQKLGVDLQSWALGHGMAWADPQSVKLSPQST